MTPAEVATAARAAATRIPDIARTTPVEQLSATSRGSLWAKCEHFQATGSFKVRGASNALLTLTAEQSTKGVVTASTGNHGAAVAHAGNRLDVPVTVFAPTSAPRSKLDTILRLGAELRQIPGDPIEAELAARDAAADSGRPYISPYNHPAVLAGQGTVGVELTEQLERIDTLVVAVGGGGLIAGTAAVVKERWPDVRVVGVSPENSAVMGRSVAAGRILDLETAPTLSDGTAGGVEADAITFPLCAELVDEWIEVSEDEIAAALLAHLRTRSQLIEGSAAAALAGCARLGGVEGTTVAVLCGGNVDVATLHQLLSEDQAST